ncbi:hypothetical protein [Flavobacterium sp. XGLA_31]|uniref:hypothetical protein n=1 Tax=Flavobacterium sp. XGLA_31 TaxID=3447666 RepID=UPI003F325AE7
MSERKNIDKLFQEKFKDFEVNPSAEIWDNIEAKLNEKKKRRVIPFWWYLTGVASVILISFLIGKSFTDIKVKPESPVVIDNNTKQNQNKIRTNNTAKPEKTTMSQAESETAVAASTEDKSGNEFPDTNKKNPREGTSNYKTPQHAVAENQRIVHKNSKIKLNSEKSKTAVSIPIEEKRAQIVLANHSQNNNKTEENKIAEATNKTTDSNKILPPSDRSSINLDELKGSQNLTQKIVTTATKTNDSVNKNAVAANTNALEELLKEKESKTTQQSKENRWQITSNVAPVFLGSVTGGSSIDPMFENNSKTYNTNLSLGVGLSYAVNNKIAVRTGINKMAVDYDTNGIVFFADLNNTGIATIDPTASGKSIHVENESVENTGLLPFENVFVNKNEGFINQKIGYYEVPVEITYALINNRFGVKIIGGVSTFFLTENKIVAISEDLSTDLGKANNLNDVHFSTNLGLGLKYGFMKSFEFSVEPTIKYQLNTFNSNAGNFKPYIFGIYSGISYKF